MCRTHEGQLIILLAISVLALHVFATPLTSTLSPEAGDQQPCHIAAYVRAGDLRSNGLTEGEAFLINNLTGQADTNCRIDRWSLVLRHRERAALRYPKKTLRLPEKPLYNYTWDEYRYSVDDQMFYGEFHDSMKRSSRSLYEKERQVYDRKLEAYAEAMQDARQWVEIEREIVHWEIQADMGTMPKPDHHNYQMGDTIPFVIASPDLNATIYRYEGGYYNFEDPKRQRNVTHVSQTELAYWAKVTLLNGTTIDVRAGDATIATTNLEASSPRVHGASVRFDERTKAIEEHDMEGSYPRDTEKEASLNDLDITVTHSGVVALRQEQNFTFLAQIEEGISNQYDLTHARLLLQYRDRPTWALEQLQRDIRLDLAEELNKAHDYPKLSYDRWIPGDRPAAVMRETAFDRSVELHRSESSKDSCGRSYMIRHFYPSKMEDEFTKVTEPHFSLMLNVSKDSAVAPLKTAFRDLQARVVLQVIVRPKQSAKDVTEKILTSDQHLRARLKGWPKTEDGFRNRCKRCQEEVEIEQPRYGPAYLLLHDLGPISVSPRKTKPIWRDVQLAEQHEAVECTDSLTHHSNTPRFLLVGDGSRVTKASAQNACQRNVAESKLPEQTSSERSTHYNEVSKLPSSRPSDEHPFALRSRFYDSWSACPPQNWGTPTPLLQSGSCSMNVGRLWAEHIFDLHNCHNKEKHASIPSQQGDQAVFIA